MRKNTKWISIFILIIVLFTGSLFVFSSIELNKLHKEEIKKIISSKGGKIKKVEKMDSSKSPFAEKSNKDNVIYRVKYEKNEQNFVAWYRGVDALNNIHSQTPSAFGGGYGEEWIFIDN